MKKITLSIVALLLAFATIQAQEKTDEGSKKDAKAYHHRDGKHKRQHTADFKKLNLTQDQQDRLIKINKDYRESVADLKKKEATTTVKDYKTQMQELSKKRRGELDNVFTREQKDQLQLMKAERKRKFDTAVKVRSEKMNVALGLSDDQSAKLATLKADTDEKIKSIRANSSLSNDQKKEQVIAVYKKQHEDRISILTPEQIKKMEGFKTRRVHKMSK